MEVSRVHYKPMIVEKGRIQIVLDYDIVCSIWQHIEVHKRTGRNLRFLLNIKDRGTPMGQGWGMLKDKKNPMLNAKDKDGKPIPDPKADVRVLPNGAGYLYLRKAVKELIEMFKPFCETLILVAHVKDKQIKVNGEEMSEMAVDLAGKLGDIICGEADAIGYIYREGNKTIISFEGGDNTIKEARPLHLRGKKFIVAESDTSNNIKVNLSEIFI